MWSVEEPIGPPGPGREEQHGREGAVPAQNSGRSAVADGESLGGVSESLGQRPEGPEGAGGLLPVLEGAQAPPCPGLPDPGRGVLWGAGRRELGVQ